MTQNNPPDRRLTADAWRTLDHTMAEARAGLTDLAPKAQPGRRRRAGLAIEV